MKLLLDTHALLWLLEGDSRLSAGAREAIDAAANQVSISVASQWEVAIKVAAGRMRLGKEADRWLRSESDMLEFAVVPIARRHVLRVAQLPHHHRDPFDRMLVAQALHEDLTLVTHDRRLEAYGVPILWT